MLSASLAFEHLFLVANDHEIRNTDASEQGTRDIHEMLYVFPLLGVTWCRHTPGADMSAVPAIIR